MSNAPTQDFVPSTATTTQAKPHAKSGSKHPLDPLSADEIAAVSLAVRSHVATKTKIKAVRFITCYLLPPPKRDVLAFLGIPLGPGEKPLSSTKEIARKAEVDFIDVVTGDAYNVILTLTGNNWVVDTLDKLPEGTQPQISPGELIECEEVIRADPGVRKLAADVGVKPEQLFADGWSIGYDERFPKKLRLQQALLFARFGEHDNLYAHPLDFIPVIDSNTNKVIHIDFPAHYKPANVLKPGLSASTHLSPALNADQFAHANRERIPPPRESFDFLPDLMAQKQNKGETPFKLRDDVKPLHVVQPEGVSFKMDGNVLEWQKWKMHIAFSHREGLAISTITYDDDGEIRPIFYRLSLAEMVVPYAAPEHPHPRKFAFDTGEYGMGTMANELSLGCDCLGQIHYLPGAYVAHDGSAVIIKNVICIHEEDAGLLWKHTDYRVGGRAHSVRSRRLVVSMICTLANYEYIWNYYFYQDGNIELEIRLTGILQAYVSAPGEPNTYGTTVAPGVNAQHHQHIFSIRVDPMVDGLRNTVVESDIVPTEDRTVNFAGNAFRVKDTVLKTEGEGAREFDYATDRRWRIVNRARKHYASGAEVGYGVHMKAGMVPMFARKDGWVATRGGYAGKALWVIRDEEGDKGGRMWPAGKYVPQTREKPVDSVESWAQGNKSIEDEDLILFLTVGTTHIPRPEDWPVMPVERLSLMFKPVSFFKINPSMDVPGGKDIKSVAAFGPENAACCA